MANTSFLYHCFNIRGLYQYVSTEYIDGKTIFNIAHHNKQKCPLCKSKQIIKKGTVPRTFQSIPIGTRQTLLRINHQRVFCKSCQKLSMLPLNFTPKTKARYCNKFKRYVLSLSAANMCITAISKLCKTSWDCIKDIQKRYLKKNYTLPSLKGVTHIGIDETFCGPKIGYITVVINLKTGVVLYTEKGKKAASLDKFWARIKRCKAKIKAIATDMGAAYISSVKKHAPDATLVIDRFHVVKLFNKIVKSVKNSIQREMSDPPDVSLLKGTHWLLLSNRDNLTDKGQEKLDKAFAVNKPLMSVYYLKEKLRGLWSQSTKAEAQAWLEDWIEEAQALNMPAVNRFIATLRKHEIGILNYYDEPITSGKVEGVNNRIKTLLRTAYGYRDFEFFQLKIKSSHIGRYAFT